MRIKSGNNFLIFFIDWFIIINYNFFFFCLCCVNNKIRQLEDICLKRELKLIVDFLCFYYIFDINFGLIFVFNDLLF